MITYSECEAKKMCLCSTWTDLHAVEKYLMSAVDDQLLIPDLARFPQAEALLDRIASTLRSQLYRIEVEINLHHVESRAAVKDTMTAVAGFAMSLVSKSREQQVAKMLRDDATVLTLCTSSYSLLHTTALAIGEDETAALALSHLEELTPLIIGISRILPMTVALDLKASGFMVDPIAAERAAENIEEAWRAQAIA